MKPPMKLFLDTADIAAIQDLVPTGMVDGVTTNPSLIAKSGRNIAEVIAEICALVEGPISAEAVSLDFETMVKEGEKLAAIAPSAPRPAFRGAPLRGLTEHAAPSSLSDLKPADGVPAGGFS